MPAYIIAIRERLHDQKEMDTYVAKASVPCEAAKKITPRAMYGRSRTLEGPECQGVVMMEFPTFEDAEAWYNSPEYTEARKHRMLGADYRFILFEGV